MWADVVRNIDRVVVVGYNMLWLVSTLGIECIPSRSPLVLRNTVFVCFFVCFVLLLFCFASVLLCFVLFCFVLFCFALFCFVLLFF